jgi:hypothetical protein
MHSLGINYSKNHDLVPNKKGLGFSVDLDVFHIEG